MHGKVLGAEAMTFEDFWFFAYQVKWGVILAVVSWLCDVLKI